MIFEGNPLIYWCLGERLQKQEKKQPSVGSGGAELSGQGPTSGGVINTSSHGRCFALYKTELVFLLFLQYSKIWLQVSDKELTKERCPSLLMSSFTPVV